MTYKILFWIDQFTLPYCISYFIKDFLKCELFAIIDSTKNARQFFENQKLVDFSKTWYYGDHLQNVHDEIDFEFLKNTESKYGLNLWRDLINDRFFNNFNKSYNFKTDEILKIVENELSFFDKILDDVKPDIVFLSQPPLRTSNLFYEICRSRGIKRVILNPSILAKQCFFSQNINELDEKSISETVKIENLSFSQLEKIRKENNLSMQIKNFADQFGSNSSDKISAFFSYIFSNNEIIKTDYRYFGRSKIRVLANEFSWRVKTKLRKKFIDKTFCRTVPNDSKYVFYPLHVDPDRNLLLGSPNFTNQIENIRQIAKSLPIDFKLLVKEHPAQNKTWREISFYKEIMDIPNVILLHPNIINSDIYPSVELTITPAGSSGFETLFYGKPCIVFSDTIYSKIPYVYKISNMSQLQETIKSALSKKTTPKELELFYKNLKNCSFDFDYFEFFLLQAKYFFYGANFANVPISELDMKSFLIKHESLLKNCTIECANYIEKISE